MSITDEVENSHQEVTETVTDVQECRDFKKGDCRRGSSCKYFHPTLEICRDFQIKGCSRMNCRFVHISRDEQQFYKESGQLPAHLNRDGSTKLDPFANIGMQDGILGRKRKSDPFGVMSNMMFAAGPQALPQNNQPNDICRDFERGNCSRGLSCRYYHPKLKICRDFQNEKCERESCRFLHITRDEESTYNNSGKKPDHIDEITLKKSKIINIPNNISGAGGNAFGITNMVAKRQKDDFIYGAPQPIMAENEVLKQKIAELQFQVTDLHKMNDTLYQQNAAYRSQFRGGV